MTLTVSAGPGSGEGALDRRADRRRRRREELEEAGFEVAGRTRQLRHGRRRAGDPLRTLRRRHRDPRLDRRRSSSPAGRSWSRCRSWSAPSARSRCSRSAAAASSPSVTKKTSRSPTGQVIRQSPSAGTQVEPGSTVSIVVSKGEEDGEGAERDRQAARAKRWKRCAQPG